MLAKFICDKLVPPTDKIVVFHAPNLRPFKKNKKLKPNKLGAITLIVFSFSLTFLLQKP